MKKQTLFKKASFILLVLVLCGVFTVSSSIAADKVYKWKIQSAYPHGDLSFELMKGFTKEVEATVSLRFPCLQREKSSGLNNCSRQHK